MDFRKTLSRLQDQIAAKRQESERVNGEISDLTQAVKVLQEAGEAHAYLSALKDEDHRLKMSVKGLTATEAKVTESIERLRKELQKLATARTLAGRPLEETEDQKTER